MNMMIREIEPCDYPGVLSLVNKELGSRHTNAENIAPRFERMKGDDRYRTFVALCDDEVVGFVSSVQSFALEFEVGFIHLVGLAVRQEWQGKGIGSRLLAHLEAYAVERGVNCILLNSGFQRTNAHTFYEHRGYDKGSYCFSKRL